MKRRIAAFLLSLFLSIFLPGCAAQSDTAESPAEDVNSSSAEVLTESVTEENATEPLSSESTPPESTSPPASSAADTGEESLPASVEKDGSYTSPEDVAEYIHTFGTLPDNFITKKEAEALGWVSSEGNLWDVAPGKSIGGDYFGNREGLLPEGDYHECDVNYEGGFRGGERIVYSDDGSIYYSGDHYQNFTQLY